MNSLIALDFDPNWKPKKLPIFFYQVHLAYALRWHLDNWINIHNKRREYNTETIQFENKIMTKNIIIYESTSEKLTNWYHLCNSYLQHLVLRQIMSTDSVQDYRKALGFARGSFWFRYRNAIQIPIIWNKYIIIIVFVSILNVNGA